MAIVGVGRLREGDEILTLSVPGNVPKEFINGTITNLIFGRSQAAELYQDLQAYFSEHASEVPECNYGGQK